MVNSILSCPEWSINEMRVGCCCTQVSGSKTLPIFYAGCNGAFFGPRGCGLGSVDMQRHSFAGLKGPANVSASWVSPADGSLKVTASGGVRVGVPGRWYGVEYSNRIDGVEVPVVWTPPPDKPNDKPLPAGAPVSEFKGGGMGLVFEIPEGGVLYAWHV
jgi:hypothetical protein